MRWLVSESVIGAALLLLVALVLAPVIVVGGPIVGFLLAAQLLH